VQFSENVAVTQIILFFFFKLASSLKNIKSCNQRRKGAFNSRSTMYAHSSTALHQVRKYLATDRSWAFAFAGTEAYQRCINGELKRAKTTKYREKPRARPTPEPFTTVNQPCRQARACTRSLLTHSLLRAAR